MRLSVAFPRNFTNKIICLFIINAICLKINCKAENQEIEYPGTQLNMAVAKRLLACDFEIFGKVQGVFFRKNTEMQANKLGLRGWCMNTQDGTVKGQLEGAENAMNEMKFWLQNTGSPQSRIEKAVFSEMKPILDYNFKEFSIKRVKK